MPTTTLELLDLAVHPRKIASSYERLTTKRCYPDYIEAMLASWVWSYGYTNHGEKPPQIYVMTHEDICVPLERIDTEHGVAWLLAGDISDIPLSEAVYTALACRGLCELTYNRPEIELPVKSKNEDEGLVEACRRAEFKAFGKPGRYINRWGVFDTKNLVTGAAYGVSEDRFLTVFKSHMLHHNHKRLKELEKKLPLGLEGMWRLEVTDKYARVSIEHTTYEFQFLQDSGLLCQAMLSRSAAIAEISYKGEVVAYIEYVVRGNRVYWLNTYMLRTDELKDLSLGNFCVYTLYGIAQDRGCSRLNLGFNANAYKTESYNGSIVVNGLAPSHWTVPLDGLLLGLHLP